MTSDQGFSAFAAARGGLYRVAEIQYTGCSMLLHIEALGAVWHLDIPNIIWRVQYAAMDPPQYIWPPDEEFLPTFAITKHSIPSFGREGAAQWMHTLFSSWAERRPIWYSEPWDQQKVLSKSPLVRDVRQHTVLTAPTYRMVEHLAAMTALWDLGLQEYQGDDDSDILVRMLHWLTGIRAEYRRNTLAGSRCISALGK